MKEASGELNMTVITIVAIAAIAALFAALWPGIRNSISNQWDSVNSDMDTVHSETQPK